jgi:hypothetical protein
MLRKQIILLLVAVEVVDVHMLVVAVQVDLD